MHFLILFIELTWADDDACKIIISGGERREIVVENGKRMLRTNVVKPGTNYCPIKYCLSFHLKSTKFHCFFSKILPEKGLILEKTRFVFSDSLSAETITLKNNTDNILNNTEIDADQRFLSNIPSERSGHKLILFHYEPMLIGGKIAYERRLLTLPETYIYNGTTKDWTLTEPMNFPVRKYHSGILNHSKLVKNIFHILAEIFRNGPYSGTAWVCGGEYFDLNKRTKKYELFVRVNTGSEPEIRLY